MLKLTPRQEKFVNFYLQCGNGTEAYKKAGYNVKNDESAKVGASRLLTNINVKQRLSELREEIQNENIATIREIQETLSEIMRDTNEAAGNRTRAADILLKCKGAYIQETNINVTKNPFEGADPDDLLAVLQNIDTDSK